MKKIYAIFEGNKILRMSENKEELIDYRNSFPEPERRNMLLAEKIVRGEKEHQQSHWMFSGLEELLKVTSCFGYFYSSTAKECKKCRDRDKCASETYKVDNAFKIGVDV